MKKTSFNEFSRNLDLGSIKFSLTQREDGPNWSLYKTEALEIWYRRFLYLSSIYKIEVNSDTPGATSVSNYEYEVRLQDEKRKIKILDEQYLSTFVDEFNTLLVQ